MDEDVFLGVIPVDETISRFYVKPLDCSGDFRGYHLLWFLRFDIASLLLVRLALRVIHDGNVVWMVTWQRKCHMSKGIRKVYGLIKGLFQKIAHQLIPTSVS